MKVTINFPDEVIAPAIQAHLDKGISVQLYITAAVRFFEKMLAAEDSDNSVGFGGKLNFARYNTIVSPKQYLDAEITEAR